MKLKSNISKIVSLVMLAVTLVSCKELPKEVEVVERRELCQYDDPAVYRSSYHSWIGKQPLKWRKVSQTEFRLLNYAAGEATQIAVGQVNGGGILANLNRWKREFDQEVLENLDGLETFEMLDGRKAYVVQLRGTFQKKMSGMPVKAEDWGVTGVICDVSGGSLVTVKMMGPEVEIETEQENLINFAKSLRLNILQTPTERSKKDTTEDKADGGGY
ncbi:MAG: hypothetical protein ACJAR1_001028 [Rubritalea sp.]|jgi:hypothetical protein|tara:strand:- start:13322 stop:13969 length:648 start_codon:yes stop_codon:yes gene_type:complete